MRVLGINGSLTPPPSRSRAALDVALQAASAEAEVGVLELRDHDLDFCDGRPPELYGEGTQNALAMIEEADAYLVATPVYRATYTGALKNLFDLVPNDPKGKDPLRGKAVGLIATGGSDHHYLVIEHQMCPLFGFFGAHTAGRGVYLSNRDFDTAKLPFGPVADDLAALGREVVALGRLIRESPTDFRPAHLGIRRA